MEPMRKLGSPCASECYVRERLEWFIYEQMGEEMREFGSYIILEMEE